jgi:hypothetical protein
MMHHVEAANTVGEPSWAPLELVLPACELEDYVVVLLM